MHDPDSKPLTTAEIRNAFAEENWRRGIDVSTAAISHFDTAAETIATLLALPSDVHVPQMVLEGYRS